MYKNKIITYQVKVEPKDLNNKLNSYLLNYVKSRLEERCTEWGYIKEITKIKNKSYGRIYSCDLSGDIVYTVDYEAKVCLPKVDDVIECKVTNIESRANAIISKVLPLSVIVISNQKVDIDDMIKVKVKDVVFKQNDKYITLICDLI